MEKWKHFLKEDEQSPSMVDHDEHYGEPEDEKIAALTSLQAALEACMGAGIPKEDIADTVVIWADNN